MIEKLKMQMALYFGMLSFSLFGCYCFSEEPTRELKEWQIECLTHLAYGNINLLSHEPLRALEDFQKAISFLDK